MLNPQNKECRHNSYNPPGLLGGGPGDVALMYHNEPNPAGMKMDDAMDATMNRTLVTKAYPTIRKNKAMSIVCSALVVALIAGLTPSIAQAQSLSPIQLDAPILPDGMVPSGPPVISDPVVGSGSMQPGAVQPMMQGVNANGVAQAYPVGTSVGPEVMQTNFVGCTACGSVGCGGCDQYAGPGFSCPPSTIGLWIRADYLIWYEKEADVIPLVTSSSDFTANPGDLLTLGAAETTVQFGGGVDDNPLDGFRLEVGAWLDKAATFGIMGRYFEIGDRHTEFSAGPDDFNFLGLPFFNTDIAGEDALDLSIQGERRGLVDITMDGDVRNWEILFRRLAQTGCNYRLDWLYGYRNFSLSETLNLSASTVVDTPPAGSLITAGTRINLTDQFDVENRFHGIDIGMTGHYHQGQWSMDYMAKVALGFLEQEIDISGDQLIITPNQANTTNVGGLYSQETNIGKNDQSEFSFIPEFDVNLGYGITPNLDFTVGYTFMWVSNVVRAGSSIDRQIDEGLIFDLNPINSNRPQANFDSEGYFLHGLNLGMTGRF